MTATSENHFWESIPRLLVEPIGRLAQWSVRRQRASSEARRQAVLEAELRATAYDLLATFERITETPPASLLRLEVNIHEGETPSAHESDELNSLLDTLRAARSFFETGTMKRFVKTLRELDPELGEHFAVKLDESIASLNDAEALLVFLGAGDDDDLHLAEHLIPQSTAALS